ncbi:hypothetical protein [Caloranaerobacter ferrireducens]|uniref:hypothetical protein n=1 Tax=Caloranaerobacter ferrireducens TaxID=1323370 RepID=UPI00084DF17E|nr:hypothetical protein [Caloranaerobacter ferrireducens]
MKIKSYSLGLIIFIILFGGILTTSYLNLWQTESTKIPAKFKEGEFKGQYNPADIRGSYTFKDISTLFEIPIDKLQFAFHLKNIDDISSFKSKDLENIFSNQLDENIEIGNDSVKLFVALYKGLPYKPEENTYLPKNAVDLLKSLGTLNEKELSYIESHKVDITFPVETQNKVSEDSNENEYIIKGKTTFKELLDWGLDKETIEGIIKSKIPNTNITIRDFCNNESIEFSEIKELLQVELDKLKK